MPIPKVYSSVWTLIIVVGFSYTVFAEMEKNYPPPKITLMRINGDRGWSSGDYDSVLGTANLTFSNSSMYVVPAMVNEVTIQCTAPYPIFWNLLESNVKSDLLTNAQVSTSRSSKDIFDSSTFNYSSQLLLVTYGHRNKLTGNYTCESTSYHKIQSSVFIYWEAKNVLVNSLETITVYAKGNPIILPCGVCTPFAGIPTLMREQPGGKSYQLPLSGSVSYSKAKGFILDNLPNPVGQYKCMISKDDYVTVKVKAVKGLNQTLTTAKSNATFVYTKETNEFVCCSGSKKPPNILIFYCDHAVTCQIREHTILPLHYLISKNKRKGNCATKGIHFMHSVVVRCIGDGIDEYKEYIAPLQATHEGSVGFSAYFKWEEIDPQEMFYVSVTSKQGQGRYAIDAAYQPQHVESKTNTRLYANQPITAVCSTSNYYFSTGTKWAVKWKNGSLIPVADDRRNSQDTMDPYMGYQYREPGVSYSSVLNTDMEAILCFAPVWNSSLWALKTYYLYVNETVKPTILQSTGAGSETQTWYLNDTNKIECESSGIPTPSVTWIKGTQVLSNNSHNLYISEIIHSGNETRGNSSIKSVLTIRIVSHFTPGEYTCKVSNFGGSVSKKFTISVIERKHWGSTIMIIMSFFIICGILGVAIYFVARMRKFTDTTVSRNNPERFTETATQENSDGIEADENNASYDNGKMRSQLVHV